MDRNIEYDKIIIDHFKNFKKITKSSLSRFFLDEKDIENYVNSLIDDKFETAAQVVSFIAFSRSLKHCKTCGKTMTYKQSMNNECCSVKCAAINEERLKMIETTNLEKYGCKNASSSSIVKDKIKSIMTERHGNDNPQKIGEIRERTLKTVKDRYGVNNSFNSKNIDKAFEMFDRWKEYVVPLFSKEDYLNPQGKTFRWKCVKCGSIFEQEMHSTSHLKEVSQRLPRCWKCYPRMSAVSSKEKDLREFCEECFNDLRFNDTKTINGIEIDIVIPEIKLAIEFNGCYWHSVENGHGAGYHLNKTRLCNENGYRLIHIWEDEWDLNKEEIKRKLIDIFEGHENLNFIDEIIILDRSWYNNLIIDDYKLIEEISPVYVCRLKNEVENCGYLKYEKI